MHAKERIEKSLRLEKVAENTVTLEWWGMYKYEFAGLDYRNAMFNDGQVIAETYKTFYEYFKPDWFHLHIGTPKYFKGSELVKENGSLYIIFQDKYLDLKSQDKYFSVESANKKEIVIDIPDYILESKNKRPKVDLSSKLRIDEFIERYVFMNSDLIMNLGYTDHVKEISKKYGDDIFINVHIPSEICEILDPFTGYVGFEDGLVAFYDYPEGMKYLIEKCYEAQLQWVEAYKKAGAHGFNISEDNMAADSVSPKIYREFLKPVHIDFFTEVRKMGLFPLLTFWGDINPVIADLKDIKISGLAIEENRKNFKLDAVEIIKKLGDSVCLFGNVDSVNTMMSGNIYDIRKEIDKQNKARKYGNFIFQNGSPIAPGTSKENILEMVNYARRV